MHALWSIYSDVCNQYVHSLIVIGENKCEFNNVLGRLYVIHFIYCDKSQYWISNVHVFNEWDYFGIMTI